MHRYLVDQRKMMHICIISAGQGSFQLRAAVSGGSRSTRSLAVLPALPPETVPVQTGVRLALFSGAKKGGSYESP